MSWTITGTQKVNWTPSLITTSLWLDAADFGTIALSSGAVSQWNDKSGNSRNVSQSTPSLRPAYSDGGLNSKPTIDWGNLANDKLLTNTSTYNPVRIYGVALYEGPNPFDANNGLITFNFTGSVDLYMSNNSGTTWFNNNPVFLNGGSTSSATALPGISAPFIFATDFTPIISRTTTWVGNDRGNTSRSWRGKISEIIILPTVPGTFERNQLEGYLAHKWGLASNLPSDHQFKTAPPVP